MPSCLSSSYSSKSIAQHQAVKLAYGEYAMPIATVVQRAAVRAVSGGIPSAWQFISVGKIGFWAPDSVDVYTVSCSGYQTDIRGVNAETLGLAFTSIAMCGIALDAHNAGDERLCDQIAEWIDLLSQYAYETATIDNAVLAMLTD